MRGYQRKRSKAARALARVSFKQGGIFSCKPPRLFNGVNVSGLTYDDVFLPCPISTSFSQPLKFILQPCEGVSTLPNDINCLY